MTTYQKIVISIVLVLAFSCAVFSFSTWRNMNILSGTINNSTIGATTPSTGVFTSLQVNTGIPNSVGFQHFRSSGTSCTTGSANGSQCTTGSISLPVTEPDGNYSAICTIFGSATGSPVIQGVGSKSTGSMTLSVINTGGVASSYGTADCIVVHD